MRLSSSAFPDGAAIPRRLTCDGENLSPPLEWSDAPAETRSFVLLCDDPDAPGGTFHHWAAFDTRPRRRRSRQPPLSASRSRTLSKPSTTSGGSAMAAPALRTATGRITIISGCWRFRSTDWYDGQTHPAAMSNAKHARI